MACRDPEQFAALVGPKCGGMGPRSRECRGVIPDALRQYGNGCLATPLVPGWPPLVRYVCPSTDEHLGPLCPAAPVHGAGGAQPASRVAVRRDHTIQIAGLATVVSATGIGLVAHRLTRNGVGRGIEPERLPDKTWTAAHREGERQGERQGGHQR